MTREQEIKRFPKIEFSECITETELALAYNQGMLRKSELIDGKYYLGVCRNAYVAQWIKQENSFLYMRYKLGNIYPEKIFHPEDDNGRDLFIPFKEVEPRDSEMIGLAHFSSFVLQRKKQA